MKVKTVATATCYIFFALCFDICTIAQAKREPQITAERDHRKSHSECLVGKQHKELGSTWFPDLGPPFGTMYCMKCECTKVVRQGRIYAHTKCEDLRDECRELSCDDQIQVVGRCCKVCRNDTDGMELQDVTPSSAAEEEEKSYKHYAALLTTSIYALHKNVGNMSSAGNLSGQSATARFMLHKHNLYYSFFVSAYPLATKPKTLQFVNSVGIIVEEQQIPRGGSLYQELTGKICGVWRRVSSEFRMLLKEEKLSVILMWEEHDLKIQGSLMRYRPLTTEVFSSLMMSPSDSPTDAAGTAIISISTVMPTVHVMVIFNGLLSTSRKNDVLLQLKLMIDDKVNAVIDETIGVEKPSSELNVIEYSSAVSPADLLALTQQRASVSLISARYKESIIQGKVVPRVQCELFQAVLSSAHQNSAAGNRYPSKPTKASGFGWMFIDKNSSLQYFVTLDNVADVSVELVSHRHQSVLETLSSMDGWSNGIINRLQTKQLQSLYDEELAINVARMNGNNPSLIRGRLTSRPVADSRDSVTPYLLKRSDTSVPADMVGLIWARVDNECNLYYDISIARKDTEKHHYELYLEDIPMLVPNAPVTRRLLEEFEGNNVEGYRLGLTQNELYHLQNNVVSLDIWDVERGQSVLKTRWDKVSIPAGCLPPRNFDSNSTADNNIPPYLTEEGDTPEVSKCLHGLRYYEHGAQWTSTLDACNVCHCNRGVTKCDVVICPVLNCSTKYTAAGSCCPSCNDSSIAVSTNSSQGCQLDGRFFAAGSAWYPYVPPYGFDPCTICQCEYSPTNMLDVRCKRMECPRLTCDEKEAVRPEKQCCKTCPIKNKTLSDELAVSDQLNPAKYERDILTAGGCKYRYGGPYENGKEWHPRIVFYGEQKCVTCKCKDGKVTCERKKCTKYASDDPCCVKKPVRRRQKTKIKEDSSPQQS